MNVHCNSLSRVLLFATLWTMQSMEFSRPEYWSRYPFPSPGDLPKLGIETRSPALQADSLPAEPQGKPLSSKNNDLNKDVLIIINIGLKDPTGAKKKM